VLGCAPARLLSWSAAPLLLLLLLLLLVLGDVQAACLCCWSMACAHSMQQARRAVCGRSAFLRARGAGCLAPGLALGWSLKSCEAMSVQWAGGANPIKEFDSLVHKMETAVQKGDMPKNITQPLTIYRDPHHSVIGHYRR
jgi:hypothetical protein